jgi:hypothetical protein
MVSLIKRPPSWWSDLAATVSSVTGRSQNKPAAPSSSADKPNPSVRKKANKAEPPQRRADAEEGTPVTPLVPTAPMQPHTYPFPLAQDVPVGTSRSAIFTKFGPPTALVTGAETGQVRERFIYIEQGKSKKTVMFLTNGAVTSSETTAL